MPGACFFVTLRLRFRMVADSPQITETKTLDGDIRTITYTTTSIYETVIPTTIYETTQLPESTTNVIEDYTVTATSLCAVSPFQTNSQFGEFTNVILDHGNHNHRWRSAYRHTHVNFDLRDCDSNQDPRDRASSGVYLCSL